MSASKASLCAGVGGGETLTGPFLLLRSLIIMNAASMTAIIIAMIYRYCRFEMVTGPLISFISPF